jgi:hypothetical protein
MQGLQQSVESWSVERVVEWLSISGLGHLSHNFESHRITGDILRELSSTDLEEIGVHALGDKKRFLRAASQLHGAAMPTLQNVAPPPPPPSLPAPYPATFNNFNQCSPYLGQQQHFGEAPSNLLAW